MGLSINFSRGLSDLAIYANRSWANMYTSLNRLASGYRINSAADGPAQLVISEQLRTQIGTLSQEIENTTNTMSKYSTASSTLSELRSQLTELRTLAVGAANEGGNDEAAQAAYDATAKYVVDTYNRIISTADYNGSNLVDGTEGSVTSVDQLTGIDLSSGEAAEASMVIIDEAIGAVDTATVEVGATQKNQLESQIASLRVTRQNLIAAESQIRDTDYLAEFSSYVRTSIQMSATLSMMAHTRQNAATILGILK